MMADYAGSPDHYLQSYGALHSLLTAAALSTKAKRVCLVTPGDEPDCLYIASSDERQPPQGRRYAGGPGDVSAEVRYGEQLLGRLVVEGAPEGADPRSLEAFASTAGFMLGQAGELEEATAALDEARILGELGAEVGEHFDLDSMLTSIVKGLRQLLRADFAAVATLEPGGGTRWAAMDGQHTDTYKHVTFAPGKGIAARAIEAGGPIFVEDFDKDPGLPADEIPIITAEGGVSALAVPLMLRGTATGALVVGTRTPHKWGRSEIRLATLLANGSAFVIHQARTSALEKSERAVLENVIEHFPGVLLVIGPPPDYRILFASRQVNRFLSEPYRSGAPIAGLGAADLGGESSKRSRALRKALARVFETGESVGFERFESEDPRAGKIWWNWRAVPIGNREAGAHEGQQYVVLIATDVTEAVTSREKEGRSATTARTRAEELEAVIGQMVDGVAIFDRNGEITRINPEGERLLGRGVIKGSVPDRQSELYGLYTLEGKPYETENLPSVRALKGETVVGEQILVKRPDGDEIIISANVSPLTGESGEIYGAVGVFHDITQEKLVERLKDDFLSVVSHELRTPLTAIMGHTDLMLRGVHGPLSDRQGKALRSVKGNADRLLLLINDLLDVSRLEAGSIHLEAGPIDLGDLISRTITETRVLASEAGVSVYNRVPSRSLPEVVADDTRLQQVIANLLSNALKFTPAGGRVEFDAGLSDLPPDDPALRERAWPPAPVIAEHADPRSVVVTVKDSGAGLAADQLELIWDRFYQVDSTTKRRSGGAGLGLAIARNLVELHGGRAWARSKGINQGSTFSFTLPIASAPARDRPARDVRPGGSRRPARRQTGNEARSTVLVVEDDDDQREIISEMLELDGYNVLLARDGDEGIELAIEERPAMIILDVMLPHADGWEVLHRLRSRPETGHIPVLIMSVMDQPGFGKKLGANEYLLKPLEPHRLRQVVRRLAGPPDAAGKDGSNHLNGAGDSLGA